MLKVYFNGSWLLKGYGSQYGSGSFGFMASGLLGGGGFRTFFFSFFFFRVGFFRELVFSGYRLRTSLSFFVFLFRFFFFISLPVVTAFVSLLGIRCGQYGRRTVGGETKTWAGGGIAISLKLGYSTLNIQDLNVNIKPTFQ